MRVDRKPTQIIAAVAVTASLATAGLAPAVASARVWDSDFLPVYTLTKTEKGRVCGAASGGTLYYADGFSVNCASGEVFYQEPPRS